MPFAARRQQIPPNTKMLQDITAHFYRTEEVCAALIHAISSNKKPETFFWAQELIDSGATHLLIYNLVWAYSINYSHRHLEWLTAFADICFASEIIDEERLQEAVQSLLALPQTSRDGSFILSALHVPKKPDVPTTRPQIHPNTLHVLSQPSQAWLGITCNKMQAVLDQLLWLASTHCDLLPAGLPRNLFPALRDTNRELLDGWQSLLGRRARRVFAIPSGALNAMTERGAQATNETTTDEIRNLHGTFHLSSYWSTICPQTLRCDEDPVWEKWLTTIFLRDDIPEEWSTADQLKSHGPGCQHPGSKPTVGKWLWNCVPHDAIAMPAWFQTLARRFETTELVYPQTIQSWLSEKIQETLLERAMAEINMKDN